MANTVGSLNVELGLGYAKFQSDMGKATQVARQETQRMATAMRQQTATAKDSLDLLGDAVGIRLPRELKKVVSESTLIGPALSAAFNISAIAAFGAIFVDSIIPKIIEATNVMAGFTEEVKKAYEQEVKFNQALTSHLEKRRDSLKEFQLIGLKGSERSTAQIGQTKDDIALLEGRLANARAELARQQELVTKGILVRVDRMTGEKEFAPNEQAIAAAKNLELEIGKLNTQLESAQDRMRNLGREAVVALEDEATTAAKSLQFVLRDIGDGIKDVSRLNVLAPTLKTLEEQIMGLKSSRPKLPFGQDTSQMDAFLKLQERGKEVFAATRTEAEQYAARMAELNELVRRGAIDHDTYSRAVSKLKSEFSPLARIFETLKSSWGHVVEGIALGTGSISSSFRRMAASVIASIAQMIAKMLAMWLVQKLIGFFFPAPSLGGLPAYTKPSISAGIPVPTSPGGGSSASGGFSAARAGVTIHVDARGAEAGMEHKIMRAVKQAMQETQNRTLMANRELALRKA